MSCDESESESGSAGKVAGEIARLLESAAAGSVSDLDRLLQIVYDELRVIARSHMRGERLDHTYDATALVNESYLRLFRVAGEVARPTFEHRHAFYKAAATAMRRILIDHARAKAASKRVNPVRMGRISVDVMEASVETDPHDLLSIDEALFSP